MKVTKTKKQVLYLYACTFIGMGIGVFVSIMNTNFLEPNAYGDVRYVNNLINFFSGIFLVGYFVTGSRLLAIAETKEEVKQLKGGMLFILMITALLMMVAMGLCALYHWYIGKDFYSLFLYVMPISANVMLLNYINTSSQGDNSIGIIGFARLLPSMLYLVIAYIIYSHYGATSILMLLLQGGIAFASLLFLIIYNGVSFKNLKTSLRNLNKENKQYGLQVYYGSLANVSVQYIAGISLGLFGSDNANVGFYSLALTITSPLTMLPSIIGTTYFKKFATQNQISKKVITTTFVLSVISLIGFVVLIFPLVDLLYSKEYSSVALFASLLAIGSTCQGLGDVFNRFLGAHGKGIMLRNGAFISGTVALFGYTFCIKYWGIDGAIVTRILSSLFYFLSMLIFYLKFRRALLQNNKV